MDTIASAKGGAAGVAYSGQPEDGGFAGGARGGRLENGESAKAARRERLAKYWDSMKFALYCATHPLDGFWDLTHEKRGTMAAANTILFLTLLVISVKYTYTYFHQAIVKTPIVIFTPEGLKIPRTFHKPLVWDYPGISDITVLEKNDHTMQMLITGKEVTHPSGHQYFGLNYPFSKAMTKETRNRLEEAAKRYKLKLSFRKAE